MTKQEFYEDLNDRITVGCQLPFSLPEKALDSIVKYAAKWFHRNWVDAVDNIYMLIPGQTLLNNEEFKLTRKITLPKCIYSVNAVAKDKYAKQKTNGYPDFSFDKYIYSNWGVNGGFAGVEDTTQSDAVMGYVIASSWGDLSYHILNYPISYSFNRNTHKLFLKGSLENTPDFLLECDVRVPDEALYELDLFYDYCLAHAKIELANILGSFGMTLPGNATINYDRYADQGNTLLEQVKEEVRSMRGGSDFFLHTNGL